MIHYYYGMLAKTMMDTIDNMRMFRSAQVPLRIIPVRNVHVMPCHTAMISPSVPMSPKDDCGNKSPKGDIMKKEVYNHACHFTVLRRGPGL